MIDKWDIDIGEFVVAQKKLEELTKGLRQGVDKTLWIEQGKINKRLMSLIKQLKKKRKGLFG